MRPLCFEVQMSGCSTAASVHVLSLRSGLCCRLLVGAPRAKALGGQKSTVTGGLYRCDMNRNDCSRIDFDNSGEVPADTCAFFPANVGVLTPGFSYRGQNQRKQREAVDGSVGQQPGAGGQGDGMCRQKSGSLSRSLASYPINVLYFKDKYHFINTTCTNQ